MTKAHERYARKGNAGGEVATGEPAPRQPYLGVRTRAKTLALRRLHDSRREIAAAFSYLQLRSRRLEKHLPRASAKNRLAANPSARPSSKIGESQGGGTGGVTANLGSVLTKRHALSKARTEAVEDGDGAGIEASCGENDLELDTDVGARETTIRESEAIATPCSTTRAIMLSTKNKKPESAYGSIPTALDMEELFVGPEQILQQSFIDKYNFDVVKDQPLPGRYEWLKLDS